MATESVQEVDNRLRLTAWLLLFIAVAVAAGMIRDVLWNDWIMLGGLGAGMTLVGAVRLRVRQQANEPNPWSQELWRVGRDGILLGALLLSSAMLCWFLVDALSGGRWGLIPLWLGYIAVAELIGLTAFGLLLPKQNRWWEWFRLAMLTLVTVCAVGSLSAFIWQTGPRDLSVYPSPVDSPYRLPFPQGTTLLCNQGNRAVISHRGHEEFAYDFAMPVGSDVCAARGGIVRIVVDQYDGNGLRGKRNNQIVIDHGDGTYGAYLHLRQRGSYVKVNDRVEQGQVIAASGNVGFSVQPHLHFEVYEYGDWLTHRTVPVTFAEVSGDGIPRMYRRYTSGNMQREPE